MIDIKDLELEIEKSWEKWIEIDLNDDEKINLCWIRMNSKKETLLTIQGLSDNKNENEIGFEIMMDAFENWKNVKLKHTISEELAETLLENGKITEEDLEKEIPFGKKLFNSLLTNQNLTGKIMVAFQKINTKKKKNLKKK